MQQHSNKTAGQIVDVNCKKYDSFVKDICYDGAVSLDGVFLCREGARFPNPANEKSLPQLTDVRSRGIAEGARNRKHHESQFLLPPQATGLVS